MATTKAIIIPADSARLAEAVRRAADVLAAGGLVVLPTDTVYGVAADGRLPGAEERLARAKGRPEDKPIPLLAAGLAEVENYGAALTPAERRLAEAFWPGPLTLVLRVPRAGAAAREGFRVPDCATALALLRAVGGVLRVTSANRSGEPPALTAAQAADALGASVELFLDGGPAPGGVPSSVVQIEEGGLNVLRAGAIPEAALRQVLA